MRYLIGLIGLVLICTQLEAQKIGINTEDPNYTLDVRGLDNTTNGGELQLATPGQTNFLRFFGGRLGDPNPFLAFNELDTFHVVTTNPLFTTYNRKMTLLPSGKLGLGTDKPLGELDIRTNAIDDGSELHLSNSDASNFLRLFSGKPSNPFPSIFWKTGSQLDLASFDGNLNYQPFLRLDGKTIHVLNNNESVFLGDLSGQQNIGARNTSIGSMSSVANTSGERNTVLGYGAGNQGTFSRNILIGYEAGKTVVGNDKLYIENSASATPLIYGEFDNNLIRINGMQQITGSLELNRGIASGIALRVNGQEALWSDGNYFSYGFGTDHNYFAKPVKIGPVEGSTAPYADLHLVNSAGNTQLAIESYSGDAILQFTASTNSSGNHWTIRRRGTDGLMLWRYNNLNKMAFTPDGELGIGTTVINHQLEVAGDTKFTKSVNSLGATNNYVSTIENTSNNNNFRNNGLSIIAGQDVINSTSNATHSNFIEFKKPGGTVIGSVTQFTNSSLIYYETSDARLKRNIKETSTGIETLMNIAVRDYNWVSQTDTTKTTTGFIAQELYNVYPAAARQGGEDPETDPWQIAPKQLIPLIVKSVQDQQKEIQNLKSENLELSERVERLEKLLLASMEK